MKTRESLHWDPVHFIRILVLYLILKTQLAMLELIPGLCSRRSATNSLDHGTVIRLLYDTLSKIYRVSNVAQCVRGPKWCCVSLIHRSLTAYSTCVHVFMDATAELSSSIGNTGLVLYKYALKNQSERFGLCKMPFDRRLAENKACSYQVGQATSWSSWSITIEVTLHCLF